MPRSSSSTGKRIRGYGSRTGLGTYWNFTPGSRLEILDPHTVRFVFPEPDGGAMARLVLMHIGQSPVLSRTRLGGEELVNSPRRWPVGHGPIQASGRLLPPETNALTTSSWKPIQSIGTRPGCRGCNASSLTTRWAQHDAVELVKTGEGRVDLVSELSPLETLRVAQSPFAKVVKNRDSLGFVFGQFNMRKAGSPWRDVRLRQAVNLAINREDLIRYATKGNGVIVPALLPVNSFGYDPDLAPYAFDPVKARALLREAGYPDGPAVTLIAPAASGSPGHRGRQDAGAGRPHGGAPDARPDGL